MERITAARERLWREPSGPWSLPPRPSSPPRSHRPGPVSCQSVQTPSEGQRGPRRGLHCPAQVAPRQVPSAHRGRAELRSSHGSERFLPGSRGTLHGDNTPLNTSGARTLGFPLSSVFPSAGPRSGRAQPGGGGSHGPRGSAGPGQARQGGGQLSVVVLRGPLSTWGTLQWCGCRHRGSHFPLLCLLIFQAKCRLTS